MHKTHDYCKDEYCKARDFLPADMPCPLCKCTQAQCDHLEDELMVAEASMPMVVPDSPDRQAEASSDDAEVAAQSRPFPVFVGKASAPTEAAPSEAAPAKAEAAPAKAKAAVGKAARGKARGAAPAEAAPAKAAPAKAAQAKAARGKAAVAPAEAVPKAARGRAAPAKAAPTEAAPAEAARGKAAPAKAAPEAAPTEAAPGEAAMAEAAQGTLFSSWPEPSCYCSLCGQEVPFVKCRIHKKSEKTWRCDRCHVKITQMYQHKIDVKHICSLSNEEVGAFFNEIHGLSAAHVAEKARGIIAKTEAHKQVYANGGEYLPLSAWAVKGFDTDRIRDLSAAEDIIEHDVLGTTYRVKILSKGEAGERGSTWTNVKEKRQRTATPPASCRSVVANESSMSDSDSSKSSSSSSHKKKKKAKQAKKAKKAKKIRREAKSAISLGELRQLHKEQLDAAKESEKLYKAEIAVAQAALKKLQSPAAALRAQLASLESVVPEFSLQNAKDIMKNAEDAMAMAQNVIDKVSPETCKMADVGINDTKEVNAMVKDLGKAQQLLSQLGNLLGR